MDEDEKVLCRHVIQILKGLKAGIQLSLDVTDDDVFPIWKLSGIHAALTDAICALQAGMEI